MELSDFKALLTEQELKKYSDEEIESLYRVSVAFSNFAFKKWTDEKIK